MPAAPRTRTRLSPAVIELDDPVVRVGVPLDVLGCLDPQVQGRERRHRGRRHRAQAGQQQERRQQRPKDVARRREREDAASVPRSLSQNAARAPAAASRARGDRDGATGPWHHPPQGQDLGGQRCVAFRQQDCSQRGRGERGTPLELVAHAI